VIIDTPNNLQEKLDDKKQTYLADLSNSLMSGEAIQEQEGVLISPAEVMDSLKNEAVILVQDILRGTLNLKPAGVIDCQGKSVSQYASRFQKLREDIESYHNEGFVVRLFSESQSRCERIQRSLESLRLVIDTTEHWDDLSRPVIVQKAYPHGFLWEDAKILLLGESDLFGHSLRSARKKTTAGARLESFVDLKPGDYVVHEAHGIGQYQGTTRIQSEGTWRDYLLILYKGSDKLYVPVDQFDRVQKYIGSIDTPPPLNDLSGNAWQRQKNRVRASVKQLAFNLVALYAKRQATPGYAYQHPGIFENEFADRFEYELTDDQQRAIAEVLHDMEKPINMDRLLCGDVGYGKTEVAMRAAFRAIMGGKQVAVLAPTTILVKQHEKTFRERFKDSPVEIASVSRFNTARETREILARLRDKKVDILIGTHRLLSKDVVFNDLGLLIIDEEQRFGVAHKEKIQSMKQTVDVLTLSATPIPRTLNMSMVGVRDMSLLETPPENRLPIQTYVMDYSDAIVRGAITRELNRDGQVFFLYNRVQNIEKFAAHLATLLPDTKIGIAHGQMSTAALEDVMSDFYQQKLDVLVCSTIIENGLDVPSANTLMVYDADRFGLSQLYQLRGRVGRSWQSAYAYFFVRPDKVLTEDAQKRLAAIQEFTEFGAGFRIAMRDLEIRGAGNMFGPEQSGQIASVGYDMYWKLIEEAIREAQGDTQAVQVEKDTRVELPVDAFLPESYVSGDKQRIEVYKRIAAVKSRHDLDELISDLVDRFGEPPEPVVTLSHVSYLRHLASTIGSDLVSLGGGYLSARLNESYVQSPEKLVHALSVDRKLTLSPGRSTTLKLKLKQDNAKGALKEGIQAYEKLISAMQI
jgi:transcription-repair coupling factor (superfamily II helicase)